MSDKVEEECFILRFVTCSVFQVPDSYAEFISVVCGSSYCDEYKCVREPGEEVVLKAQGVSMRVYSPNRKNTLSVQTDDNIVLYCNGNALWVAGNVMLTNHSGLVIDKDGNLKVDYTDKNDKYLYTNNQINDGRMVLFVMDSCRVVLCADKVVVWERYTNDKDDITDQSNCKYTLIYCNVDITAQSD